MFLLSNVSFRKAYLQPAAQHPYDPLGGIDCSMPPPPTMTPKRYEWRVLMIVGGFVDYAVPQRAGKADLGLGG